MEPELIDFIFFSTPPPIMNGKEFVFVAVLQTGDDAGGHRRVHSGIKAQGAGSRVSS